MSTTCHCHPSPHQACPLHLSLQWFTYASHTCSLRVWLPAVFRPLYLRPAYTHYEAENAVGLLALLLPLPQCWENRLYHQAHLYFGKSTEPKALGMLGKYSTMSHVPRAQSLANMGYRVRTCLTIHKKVEVTPHEDYARHFRVHE